MVSDSNKTEAKNVSAPIVDELCEILCASLQALAAAEQADAACGLAARACAVLRLEDPARWRIFNGLLHRLSPMTGNVERRGDAEKPFNDR